MRASNRILRKPRRRARLLPARTIRMPARARPPRTRLARQRAMRAALTRTRPACKAASRRWDSPVQPPTRTLEARTPARPSMTRARARRPVQQQTRTPVPPAPPAFRAALRPTRPARQPERMPTAPRATTLARPALVATIALTLTPLVLTTAAPAANCLRPARNSRSLVSSASAP